jgi:hypothetical protein
MHRTGQGPLQASSNQTIYRCRDKIVAHVGPTSRIGAVRPSGQIQKHPSASPPATRRAAASTVAATCLSAHDIAAVRDGRLKDERSARSLGTRIQGVDVSF